ncbi:MAG: TIGR00300 family protein, partial [Chloroflexota bacterium]
MPTETVELEGHIIDSLLLPRVLDTILAAGAEFEIEEVRIGHRRGEPSFARIRVQTGDQAVMDALLRELQAQGTSLVHQQDAVVAEAEQDGVFPEGFYCTTNLATSLRWRGVWVPVSHLEMDCGIVVDRETGTGRCLPMHRVRRGDAVVVGFGGIRVAPPERPPAGELFEFMGSSVSSEKPKARLVEEVAQRLTDGRAAGRPCLLVAGPAVVHTGGGPLLAELIRDGYAGALFAGNGLATHDLETAFYGTSLGIPLAAGHAPVAGGHQNHLRTINTIRRLGSIRAAVEQGLVTGGIMHACVTRGIPYVLAGSIRDDGPLPEVITDVVAAMDTLREIVQRVDTVLVVSSMLHAIAVGNILPASVRLVVVDINPAALTKIMDRGSFQTVGIVSDAD